MSADGSVTEQVRNGTFSRLSDDEAEALAAHFEATAERIRLTRAIAGEVQRASSTPSVAASSGAGRLPLNRKERYFTGTVLPMIVAAEGFQHLGRFLRLCGLRIDENDLRPADGYLPLQFFTEYGFGESVYTDADRTYWHEVIDADTPDVVVAGSDWLLAVEAKVFHDPTANDLTAQMERQAKLVRLWREKLALPADRVRHVLLLPERLAQRVGTLSFDVVTWEDVVDTYDRIGPQYWVSLLKTSLNRHAELESRPVLFGKNADKKLPGATIVKLFADGAADFDWIGRKGGLVGGPFQNDLATGKWRTTTYEVTGGGTAPNRNGFALADFVEATGAAGH